MGESWVGFKRYTLRLSAEESPSRSGIKVRQRKGCAATLQAGAAEVKTGTEGLRD